MTQSLSTREAAKIVGLSEAQVRALLRSNLDTDSTAGRRYSVSFQDLVILKTARELVKRKVPAARVRRALAALRRELAPDRPLSGVRIFAEGGQVAVTDGRRKWDAETGQLLFSFDVDRLAEETREVRRALAAKSDPSDGQERALREFERGLELESESPDGAAEHYRRALTLDPGLVDAYINLGRLEHDRGRTMEAIALYETALERAPRDPVLHFNLALAFEDTGGPGPAAGHYEQALELDPGFADAHYNLARVQEQLGRHEEALRHYHAYKKLTDG